MSSPCLHLGMRAQHAGAPGGGAAFPPQTRAGLPPCPQPPLTTISRMRPPSTRTFIICSAAHSRPGVRSVGSARLRPEEFHCDRSAGLDG